MNILDLTTFLSKLPKSVIETKRILPYSGPTPEGDVQDWFVQLNLGCTTLELGPMSYEDCENII
jgi:hypothetical protein